MWATKTWKLTPAGKKRMDEWIARNSFRWQIQEIAVNNAYAVEYRELRRIG